jgi:uncharacterized delta-60 repeat protein
MRDRRKGRSSRLAAVLSVLALLAPTPALAASGDLDPAFDGDGQVTTAFSAEAAANGMAIHRGKIVVVGAAGPNFAVARYDLDGTLDASFGGDGKVTTHFRGSGATARAVAVQDNGKIVAVGDADNFGRFAVARYRINGSLDTSFGGDGKQTTRIWPGGSAARAVALTSDGRIVVAGQTTGPQGSAFAVVRYLWNGSLDRNFGLDGKVTTRFQGVGTAYGVAVTNRDKIVVVGDAVIAEGFCVARYRKDGRLDRHFAHNGKLVSRKPGGARAVALAGGKVVVAGIGGDIFGPFAVERYNHDGSVDGTFSEDGRVIAHLGDGEESGQAIAIQPDGRIVVAGYTNVPHEGGDTGNGAFALVRFRPHGAIDESFGVGGRVLTEFSEGLTLGMALALQWNGKIVVAGWAGGNFGVARYLAA